MDGWMDVHDSIESFIHLPVWMYDDGPSRSPQPRCLNPCCDYSSSSHGEMCMSFQHAELWRWMEHIAA